MKINAEEFKLEIIKILDDFNLKINSCPIIMDTEEYLVYVFETDEKIDHDTINEIWEKIKSETNVKISFDKMTHRTRDWANIFFLTESEIKIGYFYSKVINKYDFLKYVQKKFSSVDNKKNRFINYKKIEMILSNIAFKYFISNKSIEQKVDFKFLINEIYLDEIFLSKYLLTVIEGLFKHNNFKTSKIPVIDSKFISKIISLDPITISKYQSYISILNKIDDKWKVIDEIDLTFFENKPENILPKNYDSEFIVNYNMIIENYFSSKDIIKREYSKLLKDKKFNEIINQNMEAFLYKGKNMERFIKHVFLNKEKDQIRLLSIMSDIMRFVDSEYKKIVKPAIFSIEDFLIDLVFRTSIELLEIFRDKSGEHYLKQLSVITNDDKIEKGVTWFHEYPSLIFKLIQKRGKSTLLNIAGSGPNNLKDSWKNLKYFVDSEFFFKKEINMSDLVYSKESFDKILEKYSKSTRIKFDINFILRKLSFSNLFSLMDTINLDIEIDQIDKSKYKYINLMKEIIDTFDKDEFNSLIEMRNAISHQDIIFNSLNKKVEEYEGVVLNFLNFMLENPYFQSYTFQNSSINVNFKLQMDNKLKGITNFYQTNESKNIQNKILPMLNFIDKYYLNLFGRKIFEFPKHEEVNKNFEVNEIAETEKFMIEFIKLNEINFDFGDFDDFDDSVDEL